MEGCPRRGEVEAVGTDPSAEWRGLEDHVAACPDCRSLLERLRDADPARTRERRPARAASAGEPPVAIEGYDVIEEIHRGGQGVVYKAIQRTTRRTVALKLLREGPIATPEQRFRFEREIDLVASLDHPNVVTVYDSGVSQGRPFYAMQYVHGRPIDQHVREARLAAPATLALFQKVCAAVSYAHQRGVIHRDLKPGNILVDAEGEPHVLDFGIAKAAGSALDADGRPATMTGEFLGTLAYASPEQARGEAGLVDVRTDVYSLGVLLYEMLTDELPYPVAGNIAEALRAIADTEPRRPSATGKRIDDDLETIVLTALAKERDRRYQSAEAFARDVQRYLAGDPIDAKRDSAWYVLRKTVRRHRVPFVTAAAALALLLAFAVTTLVQARRIAREREQAMQEAASARQVARLALDAFKLSDPWEGRGAGVSARELVDDAARRVQDEKTLRPEMRAILLRGLGDVYLGLGLRREAEPLLEQAATTFGSQPGSDRDEALAASASLARLRVAQGRPGEADALCREVLDGERALHGASHEHVARATYELAHRLWSSGRLREAEPLLEEGLALRRRHFGDVHAEVAAGIANLASLGVQLRRLEEAERHAREALGMSLVLFGEADARVAYSRAFLCEVLIQRGRPDAARAVADEALAVLDRSGPPRAVVSALRGLSAILVHTGSLDAGVGAAREAVTLASETLTPTDAAVRAARQNLSGILAATGSMGEAERLLRGDLDRARSLFGETSQEAAEAASVLAIVLLEQGSAVEARDLMEDAVPRLVAHRGADDPAAVNARFGLAAIAEALGDVEAAEAGYRDAVERTRRTLGPEHPEVGHYLSRLADLLQGQGRFREAVAAWDEIVTAQTVGLGPDHPDTLDSTWELASCLSNAGDHARAVSVATDAVDQLKSTRADVAVVADAEEDLAATLAAAGDLSRAEVVARRALETLAAAHGEDDPRLLEAMGTLAQVLGDTDRRDEALAATERAIDLARRHDPHAREALRLLLLERCRLLLEGGDDEAAIAASREALEFLAVASPDSSDVTYVLRLRASALVRLGRANEALDTLQGAARRVRGRAGPASPELAWILEQEGEVHRAAGRLELAEPLLREAAEIRRETEGLAAPQTWAAEARHAKALSALGRHAEAASLLEHVLAEACARRGERHAEAVEALGLLVAEAEALGRRDAVVSLRARLEGVEKGGRVVPGAIEAESLHVRSGDGKPQDMLHFTNAWWSGDAQLWWNPDEAGHELVLELPAPSDGRYAVTAYFTKADDYGVSRVSINGRAAPDVNLWNDAVVPADPSPLGSFDLRAGSNELVVEAVGLAPEALPHRAGHGFGLDCLVLEPIADLAAARP